MTGSGRRSEGIESAPGRALDALVIGSGVAGLTAALRLASGQTSFRVGVLTKGELSQSTTRWAQGGVAAALSGDEDSADLHLADTLAAGAGLCDVDAVRVLVDEGPSRVLELVTLGARFDREESGDLSLAREGGHSQARVVHAGGAATGAEIERALVDATGDSVDALLEGWLALDLIVRDGRCRGVVARAPDGRLTDVHAEHVVLATGGAGQLYSVTTNPSEATGDGVAMALRAGVAVADLEFVQFHPTALHHPAMPRPLLSEALRGHGAVLRDASGDRFVDELAPRDVVSRAMAARMAEQGVEHLWLDATNLERFTERFPTIAASLSAIGLDPGTDWLPIAPAAHHLSGGVLTDLCGASSLPGLWAIGETACTGVHGANRLASNSLLEGMVFGARLAEAVAAGVSGPAATGALGRWLDPEAPDHARDSLIPARALVRASGAGADGGANLVGGEARSRSSGSRSSAGPVRSLADFEEPLDASDVAKQRDRLQRIMTAGAGLIRSAGSLASTGRQLAELDQIEVLGDVELRNLLEVARALVRFATAREESRGAHTRVDFPDTRPEWRCRLVLAGLAGDVR